MPQNMPQKLTTPLTCTGLQSALTRVLPHRDVHQRRAPVLAGVLLDYRDQDLFLVAANHRTLAAARVRTDAPSSTPPWSALLNAEDCEDLAQMLTRADADEPVLLEPADDFPTDEGQTVSLSTRYRSTLLTARDGTGYPDWRAVVGRPVKQASAAEAPTVRTSLDPQLLVAWQDLDTPATLHTPRTALDPLVLLGVDFLGLQMPQRRIPGDEDGWHDPADWLPVLDADRD